MHAQFSFIETLSSTTTPVELHGIDVRLLEEAYRRARSAPLNEAIDSTMLLSAIFEEARRGSRDMFSLVSAAGRIPA